MLPDLRFTPGSSRGGFSSRATVLALAGGGAALFLFVVLPRLMTSQAAELRRSLPEEAGRVQAQGATPKDELVPAGNELVPAAVLAPAAQAEPGSVSVVENAAPTSRGATVNASQLVASTET